MTTTRTRKAKTADDLKAQIEKAKASLVALEYRAYAGELDELVKNSSIVSEFKAIKDKVKGVSDVALLTSIGKAVGFKRVEVLEKPVTTRGPRKAGQIKKK